MARYLQHLEYLVYQLNMEPEFPRDGVVGSVCESTAFQLAFGASGARKRTEVPKMKCLNLLSASRFLRPKEHLVPREARQRMSLSVNHAQRDGPATSQFSHHLATVDADR